MIEPDLTPRPARNRAATFAVITALVAGLGGVAIAVNASGDSFKDERAVASGKVANPAPAALPTAEQAADMAGGVPGAASSRMIAPYWAGLEITVDGDLPELGGSGAAYRFSAPDIDKADVARMAGALGMAGEPVRSDGEGWSVTTDAGRLQLFPGPDGWSVSYQRAGLAQGVDGKISAEAAEDVARRQLSAMGVFDGDWAAQAYESTAQGGFNLACEEALKELEARRLDGAGQTAPGSVPVSDPDAGTAEEKAAVDYPAPSACAGRPDAESKPVFAQSVNFSAVLDGVRTDWSGWSVNVRADKVVDGVYGTFATIRPAGTYDLRGTEAALDELREQSKPMASTVTEGDVAPAIARDGVAYDEGVDMQAPEATTASGSGTSGSVGSGMATPTIAPDAPVSSSVMPTEPAPACDPDAKCGQPQKVVITSVERTLTTTSIWDGDTPHMTLVPGYRFIGHFEDDTNSPQQGGSPYEVTALAIDPKLTQPPADLKEQPAGLKAVPPPAEAVEPSR